MGTIDLHKHHAGNQEVYPVMTFVHAECRKYLQGVHSRGYYQDNYDPFLKLN
jgi:hypothetical protein